MQEFKTALLIVDMQYDFLEGGSLPVKNSLCLIEKINSIRTKNKFDFIIFTQDWHPDDHISFQKNNPGSKLYELFYIDGNQEYQMMWPTHCVQGSDGAKIHQDLIRKHEDIFIKKGTLINVDSYSGFGNREEDTKLLSTLQEKHVKNVYICGLAFDYCVGKTAIDAKKHGFNTYIISDCTLPVSEKTGQQMQDELEKSNIKMILSDEIASASME